MLIRETADGPRVLLGRRSRSCRFMPGTYVMPGGRVERADRAPSGFSEALNSAPHGADAKTRTHLAVFARTALRECFEETGLLAAVPDDDRDGCRLIGTAAEPGESAWLAFERAAAAPAFGALRLVARAITPVGSPIRFHTRFFMALSRGEPPPATPPCAEGEAELEDLAWVSWAEMERLPVPEASALALREARARYRAHDRGAAWGERGAAPCFTWRGPKERLWRTPAAELGGREDLT